MSERPGDDAIPKFAAQTIRRVYDMTWKPLFVMSNVAISVGDVMTPAGPEKSIGMVSTQYLKDPTDPTWKDDKAMLEWTAAGDGLRFMGLVYHTDAAHGVVPLQVAEVATEGWLDRLTTPVSNAAMTPYPAPTSERGPPVR